MAKNMHSLKEGNYYAINFDIDTNKAKNINCIKDFHTVYAFIRDFLESNDFEHRQGSGYVTTKHMSFTNIFTIIEKLSRKYPWLKDCIRVCDVTKVGSTYSLIPIICNPFHKSKQIPHEKIEENTCNEFFDIPSEFINNAIRFNFIDISETPEGLELYMDQTLIGIYDSYTDIEMDIKECEPEIERAIMLLSRTKNKLKEGR